MGSSRIPRPSAERKVAIMRPTALALVGLASVVGCGEGPHPSQNESALATATTTANSVTAFASAGEYVSATASLLQDTARTVTRRVWAKAPPDLADLYSLSPDGRLATMTDWSTGDVAIRDVETGDTRRLTHNIPPFEFEEQADAAEISRDGKWVAYTWSDSIGTALGVVDIEGNSPRILYREEDTDWIQAVDWSPDGRSILAWRQAHGQDELLVISAENGSMRLLKTFGGGEAYDFLFSPDGRFVAYSKTGEDREENRDIFALDVSTGNENTLVRHPADDHLLGWAPDGMHVLFASDRSGTQGAWLLPVRGGRANGAPWLVKPDMWQTKGVGFADDGRFFYVVNTGGTAVNTVTFDPASRSVIGSPTAITTPLRDNARKPQWSPDGRHLVYIARDRVVIRSMETGDVKEFDLGEAVSVNHTGWSADGRSVFAGVSPERYENRMDVFRLDVQTGIRGEELRAEWNRGFRRAYFEISPDERFCFYLLAPIGSEGEVTIVREELETGDTSVLFRTPLTVLPFWRHIWGLSLSPDGQTLAFSHMGERVVLLPVEGGEPREYPVEDVGSIAWMPEGNALLVRSGEEVLYVDLADGQVHPIGLDTQGLLDVHPDGRRIAYDSGTRSAELWVMDNFLPTEASRR
jgi:Tol biopolymer transport system component